MIKWLLVIGVVAFVYYFFIKKTPLQTTKKEKTQPQQEDAQDMIECSKCGVYVEVDEAILSNGKYFCSKECLKG